MRTSTLLSITLLGLLLWASCIQADDADTETQNDTATEDPSAETEEGEVEHQKPKKEKTEEIEEENNVMVLHINNFARALSENQHVLVEFYAPWCGHCKQLEPNYAEAAGKLKEEGSAIHLAKVDATEEKELAEEFEIGGFPTLKLFTNGDRKAPIDFNGKRSSLGIIQWLKRHTGSGIPVLDSVDSATGFIDSHNLTVVGFFEDLESEQAKVFKEVYLNKADTEFAVSSSSEVFQKYDVKGNAVVLFKKFDEGRADFEWPEDGKLNVKNVTSFIIANSMELVVPFLPENAEQIFSAPYTLHTLLFINSSVESQVALLEESRAIAKKFKGKILFISIDVTLPITHVLNYFGVSKDDVPTARLINMETGKKFNINSDNLNVDSLTQLCHDVLDGNAKPYFKSEEIPEDWNKGPVKVLVGKNFESVALDPTKNVFVEFYAPWCGHCKELAPVWEKLGEKYADKEDLIIAKMDATANELESIAIQGFPTLKYFPAGGKEVVEYTGNRDLETLSTFLDNGGVLPEETVDEDEDENEDFDGSKESGESDEDDDKDADDSAEANKTTKDEL